jgi:16S rRNA (uracil1498-N3)-methyltransferase
VRRFYVDLPPDTEPRPGLRASLDAEESRHVRTVLRLADGDPVELTDGRGHVLDGVVAGGGRKAVVVEITAVHEELLEAAPPQLHLACAVVKGKRFEYAVEKAVELGAHVITPLETRRGVIDPRDGKRDRWQHLLVGALKQCGRCHCPQLRPLVRLEALLTAASGPLLYGAAPDDAVAMPRQSPIQAVQEAVASRREGQPVPQELVLLVGPEGGWEAGELQQLAARGARPLDLGPHVLRTETAAVAGLAALQQVRRGWLDPHPSPA